MFTNRKKSKSPAKIQSVNVIDIAAAAADDGLSSWGRHKREVNFHENLRPRFYQRYCFRMEWIVVAVIVLNLFQLVLANPVFVNNPSLAHFQSGRNIRHLPCVARKSGLSGVCMFAIDCIKANGTHLGTCIDRFYFGSCCQIQDESVLLDQEISDNSIDQNTISHFQHESTTLPASDLFRITTPKLTTTTIPTPGAFDEIIASSIQNITTAIIKDAIATIIPIYKKPNPATIQTSTAPTLESSSSTSSSSSSISSTSTTSTTVSTSSTTPDLTSTTPMTTTPQSMESEPMTTTLSIITTTGIPRTEPTRTTTIPTKVTTFQIVQDDQTTFISTTLPPSTQQPTTLPPIIPPPKRPTRRPPINKTTTQRATTLTTTTEEITTLPPQRPTLTPMNSIHTETTKKTIRTTTHKPYSTTKRNIVKRPGTKRPSTSSSSNRKPPKRPGTTYSPSSSYSNKRNSTKITTKKPSKYSTTTRRTPVTTILPTKSTKAPRPKPKPTATIVKVPPTIVTEEATHRESTTNEISATEEPATTSRPTTMKLTTQASSTTVSPSTSTESLISAEAMATLSGFSESLSTDLSMSATLGTTIVSSTSDMPKIPSTTITTTTDAAPTTMPELEIITTSIFSPSISETPSTSSSSFSPETSERPSSIVSTQQSETTTRQPASNTQQPTSTTRQPTTTTRQPTTTTREPISSTRQPITTTSQPISTTRQPATTTTPQPPPTTEIYIPLTTTTSLSSQEIPTTTPTPVEKTTFKPDLVTWTDIEEAPTNISGAVNETEADSETWRPIPPPDWVPLQTISPGSNASIPASTSQSVSQEDVSTKGPEPAPEIPSSPTLNEEPVSSSTDSTTSEVSVSSEVTDTSPISSPVNLDLTTEGILSGNATITINETVPASTNISSSTAPSVSFEGIDYKQICGKRMFPEPRIVGGSNAAFGRWPWQISLRQWRTSTYLHKCGAALLNENWAITAAHCVDNVPPSDLLLRLGEYDLAEEEEPYGYQERRVQIVASHPQFDPRTFEYDLALLRFYEPVTFQPNIIPVCVPEDDTDFIGQTAYVTGWGRLYEDGPLPSVLQEVSVPVINNTICETMYRSAGYIEHIPHIFICAGWKKGGYDSCEGDSGGPMVLQRDDKRFLLGGVISWGIGCAEPNQPGVYTRISEFRDWINQILQF